MFGLGRCCIGFQDVLLAPDLGLWAPPWQLAAGISSESWPTSLSLSGNPPQDALPAIRSPSLVPARNEEAEIEARAPVSSAN